MRLPSAYTDRCIEVARSIDPEQLEPLSLGGIIGYGSQYFMRSLGRVTIIGKEEFVGLKQPINPREDPGRRLAGDMSCADLLEDKMPELSSKIPMFMAALVVGDEANPNAILTEDASCNSTKRVRPLYQNYELAGRIVEAFRDDARATVDEETVSYSLSFDVDGEERLLDFTPPPVCLVDLDAYGAALERSLDLVYETKELAIRISASSELGQAIVNARTGAS